MDSDELERNIKKLSIELTKEYKKRIQAEELVDEWKKRAAWALSCFHPAAQEITREYWGLTKEELKQYTDV